MNKEHKADLLHEMIEAITSECESGGFNEAGQLLEDLLIALIPSMNHDQLDFVMGRIKSCMKLEVNQEKFAKIKTMYVLPKSQRKEV